MVQRAESGRVAAARRRRRTFNGGSWPSPSSLAVVRSLLPAKHPPVLPTGRHACGVAAALPPIAQAPHTPPCPLLAPPPLAAPQAGKLSVTGAATVQVTPDVGKASRRYRLVCGWLAARGKLHRRERLRPVAQLGGWNTVSLRAQPMVPVLVALPFNRTWPGQQMHFAGASWLDPPAAAHRGSSSGAVRLARPLNRRS